MNDGRNQLFRTLTNAVSCVASGFAILSTSPSVAQLEPARYVYTDKSALLLVPPTRVSDDTFSCTWSPDSVRLLTFNIHRVNPILNLNPDDHTSPESDLEIGRWNKLAHFSDVVWKHRYGTEPSLIGSPCWITNTQYVAQMVFWQEKDTVSDGAGVTHINLTPNQELLWINAARSTVHAIPMNQGSRLEVSPVHSLAVIVDQTGAWLNKPVQLQPIRVDGSPGSSLLLPLHQTITEDTWSSDGAKLFLTIAAPKEGGKGMTTSYLLYDPASGECKPCPKPELTQLFKPVALPQHEIILKSTIQHIRDETLDVITHPLWAQTTVKSEKSNMLVCPDGDNGIISPDGSTVAYRSQGSSWISDLKSVPLAEFKALLARAMRTVAISNAKQLALAAIMWANDHDDTLPGPDDINTQLKPYLLNEALFEQFNYTYAGGPMSAITSPAETVIGTVDGPGGVAVMYSDGHVKWQNR